MICYIYKIFNKITGIVCFPNLETLLVAKNSISDLFELTYLTKLKFLEIQNNKISDKENLDFLNMCENIEFIDISGNPLISELDKELFHQYFYIQREINNINNDNETISRINLNKKDNFDKFIIEDIKNQDELNKAIRIKANNSKILLYKE